MNIFKKLTRIFTIALSMFGLTGTNSFVPVQSPNNVFVAQKKNVGWNEDYTYYESYNIWDEEWELGLYDSSTGAKISNNSYVRSTNAIKVSPNEVIYLKAPYQLAVFQYDVNGVYLGTRQFANNTTITIPSDCHYIRFFVNSTSYGITYNHDICINVSDERINGLYFPGGNLYPQREYDELLSSYNTLQETYNNLVTSYQNLQNEYNTLNTNYNTLNSEYEDLQASYNALQTQYNNLKTLYDNLIATYSTMSGSNAFMVDNISNMRMVVNGNNQPVPIRPSLFLGSNVPIVSGATSFTINYNTDIFFRNGTKIALTTNIALHYDINIVVSLFDVDNNIIGNFNISIVFSEFSDNELYIGTYEFLNDVSSIRSIQFDIGNLSLNTTLGVSQFTLASTPYQRGYNDGYLARSDDYYQMLQQYNDEVAIYNSLLEEYQAYKNKYNASTEQTAYNNGVNSVGNATGGILTLMEGVAGVPITILNGLAPFAIWNVPVIQFIITILFFALIIWLVRKFI